MSDNAMSEWMRENPRVGGFVILVLGLLCTWGAVIYPIQQADAGAPNISISMKFAVVSVVLVVLGIGMLVFGEMFTNMSHADNKLPGILIGVVLAGLGFAAYWGMKSYLESKGYQFNR